MDLTVVDNTDQQRFEARTDAGKVAGWVEYSRSADSVALVHTEVLEEYHGQGIGSRLVSGTIDQVSGQGVTVVNQCPFISRYIARHPGDYDFVVDATD
jgi:uncharacterized protein